MTRSQKWYIFLIDLAKFLKIAKLRLFTMKSLVKVLHFQSNLSFRKILKSTKIAKVRKLRQILGFLADLIWTLKPTPYHADSGSELALIAERLEMDI